MKKNFININLYEKIIQKNWKREINLLQFAKVSAIAEISLPSNSIKLKQSKTQTIEIYIFFTSYNEI